MKNWIIGYLAAVVVIAVAIDVSARIERSADSDDVTQVLPDRKTKKEKRAVDESEGSSASRASCNELFDLQKNFAIEMAVAFAPEKNKKKSRKKITRDINQKMGDAKQDILTACMALPQQEIDCVLGEEDATKWNDCGPNITKMSAKM